MIADDVTLNDNRCFEFLNIGYWTKGIMDFVRKVTFALIVLLASEVVFSSDERISFTEKLRVMEESKREARLNIVNTSSDSDYRRYLAEQLQANMKLEETIQASVIVDVTGMGNAGLLAKTSTPSLGVSKLESIFSSLTTKNKTNEATPSPTLKVSKTQWAFSNSDNSKNFEQVGISLNQSAANLLVNHPDVKDISFSIQRSAGNNFSAINTDKARFIPPIEPTIYDSEFLKQGYYSELLDGFNEKDSLLIYVRLKGEPVDWQDRTPESDRKGLDLVSSILSEIEANQYKLKRKRPYSFLIETNKDVVQRLFEDPRVQILTDHIFNESRISRVRVPF